MPVPRSFRVYPLADKTACHSFSSRVSYLFLRDCLDLIIMFHSYYYISGFLPCFNIFSSLNNFFQCITPINNRFILPCFNQLFKKDYIFFAVLWNRKLNFFTCLPARHAAEDWSQEC